MKTCVAREKQRLLIQSPEMLYCKTQR